MQEAPGDAPGPKPRRRLFAPREAPPQTPADTRLEAMMAAYQRVIADRLDEGLSTIQQTAVSLMQDVANEVWRVTGADPEELRSTILAVLSRDQAIRGLVAHSDERFQTLDVRVGRVEEGIRQVERATADVAATIEREMTAVRAAVEESGSDSLGERVAALQDHLSTLVERIAERDRVLLEWYRDVARQTNTLVRDESARLADLVEEQSEGQADLLQEERTRVDRQLEAATERVDRQLEAVSERVDRQVEVLTDTLAADVTKTMRDNLEGYTAETLRTLDERLADVNERMRRLAYHLSSAVTESVGRVRDSIEGTEAKVDELRAGLDGTLGELRAAIAEEATEIRRSQEIRLAALSAEIAAATEGAAQAAAFRVQDAVRTVVDERIGALARMIRSDNETLAERLEALEDHTAAKEAIRTVKEAAAAMPEEIQEAVDQRMALLGELIKQESKSTSELVLKTAQALAARLDRTTNAMNERIDREIDAVIDQMGEQVATLATGWRRAAAGRRTG